jgi:hypothetical protein
MLQSSLLIWGIARWAGSYKKGSNRINLQQPIRFDPPFEFDPFFSVGGVNLLLSCKIRNGLEV